MLTTALAVLAAVDLYSPDVLATTVLTATQCADSLVVRTSLVPELHAPVMSPGQVTWGWGWGWMRSGGSRRAEHVVVVGSCGRRGNVSNIPDKLIAVVSTRMNGKMSHELRILAGRS